MPPAIRDPHRSDLGERLRELRARRRMKQAPIADFAGISVATYSRIETGTLSPERWQLILIAEALQVSATDLLPD